MNSNRSRRLGPWSVDICVILLIAGSGTDLPDGTYQAVRLSAGETYRIYDVVFAVPPQAMIEMGDQWEAADGSRGLALMVVGQDALVWINPRTGEELSRHFSTPMVRVSGSSESAWSFDKYFDALAASGGKLPVTQGVQHKRTTSVVLRDDKANPRQSQHQRHLPHYLTEHCPAPSTIGPTLPP